MDTWLADSDRYWRAIQEFLEKTVPDKKDSGPSRVDSEPRWSAGIWNLRLNVSASLEFSSCCCAEKVFVIVSNCHAWDFLLGRILVQISEDDFRYIYIYISDDSNIRHTTPYPSRLIVLYESKIGGRISCLRWELESTTCITPPFFIQDLRYYIGI